MQFLGAEIFVKQNGILFSQFGLQGQVGVTWELSVPILDKLVELGTNFVVLRPL